MRLRLRPKIKLKLYCFWCGRLVAERDFRVGLLEWLLYRLGLLQRVAWTVCEECFRMYIEPELEEE